MLHYFSSEREIETKRRDLVTQHLIEAYKILANKVSHRKPSEDRNNNLEKIISQIQLFGSKKQVSLAKKLAVDASSRNDFDLDPLLNDLRNDLRKELNLEKIEGNVQWLRLD